MEMDDIKDEVQETANSQFFTDRQMGARCGKAAVWGQPPSAVRRAKLDRFAAIPNLRTRRPAPFLPYSARDLYPTTTPMQRKIFWTTFALLGLLADILLPFWWACAATIPILFAAWWFAYRSDWF
jgi:hypothetical protein